MPPLEKRGQTQVTLTCGFISLSFLAVVKPVTMISPQEIVTSPQAGPNFHQKELQTFS